MFGSKERKNQVKKKFEKNISLISCVPGITPFPLSRWRRYSKEIKETRVSIASDKLPFHSGEILIAAIFIYRIINRVNPEGSRKSNNLDHIEKGPRNIVV